MVTLRAHLEAIRDRHGARLANQDDFLTYSDTAAALAILDEAAAVSQESIPVGVPTPGRYRLVPDWAEAIIEGKYGEAHR